MQSFVKFFSHEGLIRAMKSGFAIENHPDFVITRNLLGLSSSIFYI